MVTPYKSPWSFFALVILLSLPFWIVGANVKTFLPASLPINLPTAALMAFNPAIAAAILVYREGGFTNVKALLGRALDYGRVPHKAWYIPIFLLMPAVMAINYAWVLAQGRQPANATLPLLVAPLMFAMFFVGGLGEELGWQAYAYDRLAPRWGTWLSGLGMGLFWALFHVIPLIEANRAASWILWHCSGQVCLRVILVWLYNNTGKSVFAVTIFHAMLNVSEYLIPNYGSSYEPMIATSVLFVIFLVITFLRGGTTFVQYHEWLYREGRPNLWARWINRVWAAMFALGIIADRCISLEVKGRKSGRTITFPLAMATQDGQRYLVSMLGNNAQWVQNVRAAGGQARLVHGQAESVQLVEVLPGQRAPILKRYLQIAPGARPHIAVDMNAPLEAFERVADQYPVFKVVHSA